MRYRSRKKYLQRVADTGPALINTAPVRDHIQQLRRAGYSPAAIAAAAGLSPGTISDIAAPTSRWTRRGTATTILQLDGPTILNTVPDHTHIPTTGARRRIHALQALGWPLDLISTPDLPRHTLHQLSDGTLTATAARTHRAVATRYEQLSMRPGPSNHTRGRARKQGWPPPLAIDDHKLDTPEPTNKSTRHH